MSLIFQIFSKNVFNSMSGKNFDFFFIGESSVFSLYGISQSIEILSKLFEVTFLFPSIAFWSRAKFQT